LARNDAGGVDGGDRHRTEQRSYAGDEAGVLGGAVQLVEVDDEIDLE
jgi:hypothetical protein